jgi:hypothetical protein
MSEIVNLRQARKRRDRAEQAAQAAENRAKFGRTKAEIQAEGRAAQALERVLDGAKREENASGPIIEADLQG